MQDLVTKFNIEKELITKRFKFILENSPIYKNNAAALGKDLNKGKRSDSIYDYKNGGSMHLLRALELANLLKIHYSDFYIYNNTLPQYTYMNISTIEDQFKYEQKKIRERFNNWIKEDNLNIDTLEIQIEQFLKIGENNIYKILAGNSNVKGNKITTLLKLCIIMNKTIFDLTKQDNNEKHI